MKIIVLLLLVFAFHDSKAATPPASVLHRHEQLVRAEIDRNYPSPRPIAQIFVEPIVIEDRRCESVSKYALGVAMLQESGIPLSAVPRAHRDFNFDTALVENAIRADAKAPWNVSASFVRWNCELFGFDNLNKALEYGSR